MRGMERHGKFCGVLARGRLPPGGFEGVALTFESSVLSPLFTQRRGGSLPGTEWCGSGIQTLGDGSLRVDCGTFRIVRGYRKREQFPNLYIYDDAAGNELFGSR